MRRSGSALTIFTLMILGLVGGAFIARLQFGEHEPTSLPRYGRVPPFSFVDSQGAAFDSHSMHGKVWTLNFFFTSCPAVCPALMGRLAAIANTHGETSPFQLVSVTIDPDTDTLEVLEDFRKKIGARTWQWRLLRGSEESVRDLRIGALKIEGNTEKELHTTRVLLVDGEGEIRGYYKGMEDSSMKELQRDLQLLLPQ